MKIASSPLIDTVAATVIALSILVIAIDAAAQTPASQPLLELQEQGPPPQASPAPQPSSVPENPGLIGEMGKLFNKILPPMKNPGEAIDNLGARAKDTMKDAGDALSRLKPGAMVKGRMACPMTAGPPDCKLAADKLCQNKGYKEGKSLGTDSAETARRRCLFPDGIASPTIAVPIRL